jgi:hypothetical protein
MKKQFSLSLIVMAALTAAASLSVAHADGWRDHRDPRGPRWDDRRDNRPMNSRRGDLSGYCRDDDHSQFMIAREFAYSGSGLNLSSNDAINWAMNYNQSHDCGTINEYKIRFNALKDYAYSGSYLNKSAQEAVTYAQERAEYTTAEEVNYNKVLFTQVKDFFYSGSYLNDNASTSVAAADEWVSRRNCGDDRVVGRIKQEYRSNYDFAYSGSGLNMNVQDAKNYAIQRIVRMTPCSDLFR